MVYGLLTPSFRLAARVRAAARNRDPPSHRTTPLTYSFKAASELSPREKYGPEVWWLLLEPVA